LREPDCVPRFEREESPREESLREDSPRDELLSFVFPLFSEPERESEFEPLLEDPERCVLLEEPLWPERDTLLFEPLCPLRDGLLDEFDEELEPLCPLRDEAFFDDSELRPDVRFELLIFELFDIIVFVKCVLPKCVSKNQLY
jgi:hypothetical protein